MKKKDAGSASGVDAIVKPAVNFCWHCGQKLYGNHFASILVFDLPRICHKRCAEDIKKNGPESRTYDRNYDGPGEEDGPWAEGWDGRCGV